MINRHPSIINWQCLVVSLIGTKEFDFTVQLEKSYTSLSSRDKVFIQLIS